MQVRVEQAGIAAGLQEGLQHLSSLQAHARDLEAQMNRALALEQELGQRQAQAVAQLSDLEQMQAQHAGESQRHWEEAARRARSMAQWQQQQEALQAALAASSTKLLDHSSQLQNGLELLVTYQRHTASLVRQLLGGSASFKVRVQRQCEDRAGERECTC